MPEPWPPIARKKKSVGAGGKCKYSGTRSVDVSDGVASRKLESNMYCVNWSALSRDAAERRARSMYSANGIWDSIA